MGSSTRGMAVLLKLFKLFWIFVLCSVLGFVAETVFVFLFSGELESRKGLLYGPFNQVYGIGGVLLALLYPALRNRSRRAVFLWCAVAGGVCETACSLAQELLFGTVSWDYGWMPLHLFGGRTNLLYMLLFGMLGALFTERVYPAVTAFLGRRAPTRTAPRKGESPRGRHVFAGCTLAAALLMALNIALSAIAVDRWTERLDGVPPETGVDRYLDTRYPDRAMRAAYPSMAPAGDGAGNRERAAHSGSGT